jgi:hypothetical protein
VNPIRETLAGEFERGRPWNPRKNPADANPLYGRAVKWSTGHTAHGEADFLTVRDDDGTVWSVLVGTYRLRQDLQLGEISEWDSDANEYRVVDMVGPVKPGELVALEYRGERSFTNKEGRQVTSPDYRVMRKPGAEPASDHVAVGGDAEIPF